MESHFACLERLDQVAAQLVGSHSEEVREELRELRRLLEAKRVEVDQLAYAQADAIVHSSMLVSELEAARAEVDAANSRLTERVRERTAELEALNLDLSRMKAQLQAIMDFSPAVIFVKDVEGRYLFVNRHFEKIHHTAQSQLGGKTCYDVFPKETADALNANDQVVLSTGAPLEFEESVPSNDGVHTFHSLRFPLRDGDGNTYAICGIASDISARKKAEESLRQLNLHLESRIRERTAELEQANATIRASEEQVRLLLDSTAEGIYGTDASGLCVFCNPACAQLLGYKGPEELLGKNLHALIHHTRADGTNYPVEECRVFQAFREGKATHVDDEVFWRADGTSFPVEYHSRPMRRDGQVIGAVVSFNDITVRRRAEEELRRAKEAAEAANRAKSEFLANMSHEIRTPMNGILGMTELVLDTELTPSQRECLEAVRSSGEMLLAIINEVLDFSKIETRQVELDKHEFRLQDVIAETIPPLVVRARQRGLELTCQIGYDVPGSLIGDGLRIKQVLVNLVGNAIKFTKHGEVAVQVGLESRTEEAATLRFRVRDTGIGIPPEKRQLIFEPFTQADGSTTRTFGGTGLGLTIAARLAEAMGGQITLDSEVGRGSTFQFTATFDLPRTTPPPGPPKMPEPPPASSTEPEPALRILVAEDVAINQKVLERMLRLAGHTCVLVGNGSEALAELERQSFDVILMDVQMPEMDGFEATARIREAEQGGGRRMPIIALTANALVGDRELCLAAGMDGYLSKPINAQALKAALQRVRASAAGPSVPAPPRSAATMAQPQASAAPQVLDRAVVLERVGNEPRRLRKFIDLFVEESPKMLASIRDGLAQGNAACLGRAAHALKGAVANLGGDVAAAAAQRLEEVGRSGDASAAAPALADLERQLAEFQAALVKWRNEEQKPCAS